MKLTSSRILKPVAFKHKTDRKALDNLVKMMIDLNLEDEKRKEEGEIIKEAKKFISLLFYNCCKYYGNEVRLEEMERVQGRRKLNLDELLNWKVDEDFWKETFKKALIRLRNELASSTLSRAFHYFLKYEHNHQLENPEEFVRMESEIISYLEKLYFQNDSTKMVEQMHQ